MDPKNNNTQNLISFKSNSLKQSDYDDNNSLLYLFYDQTYIFIYNLQLKKLIFEHKVRQCQKFRLLKGKYTNPKLFTKLIFFSQDKKLEIFEIFSKNNIQRNSAEIEANDNFWKNSISKIKDNYNFLYYKNNIIELSEKQRKKYLSITEINDEFNKYLKIKH